MDLRPHLLAAAVGSADLLSLLLALAILLIAAKLLGSLSVRAGQPAVLGELLAGLLLGPTFLNVLSLPFFASETLGDTIHQLGQLGVIWLMFAAGLEIELQDLRRSGRPATLAGAFGVLGPFTLGTGAALAFGTPMVESLFIGITLSATSVSISAQTLLELGRLRTREGIALLGAAVIDDILVIVGLSVFTALAVSGSGLGAVALQLGRMALVLLAVLLASLYLFPRLATWSMRLRASEGLLATVLAAVLVLAWVSEAIGGVAAITGAFLGGVGLARSHLREEVERGLHPLAYAFFVPLFLVDIGLQSNVLELQGSEFALAAVLILVALGSKLFGSGLGAWLGGFDLGASFRMGLGMISRGEVGLIVAGVGVTENILPRSLFTIIVLMVIVTTLVTPLLLRWAFGRVEVSNGADG